MKKIFKLIDDANLAKELIDNLKRKRNKVAKAKAKKQAEKEALNFLYGKYGKNYEK